MNTHAQRQPTQGHHGLADGLAVLLFGLLALLVLLALQPRAARGSTLFGLVDSGEMFASTDQGIGWTIRGTLPVRDAVWLAAGATTSDLRIITRSGVAYRSADAGISWTAVGAIPASDAVDAVLLTDLTWLVLTESGSVYRSTDDGTHFTGLAALTAADLVSVTVARTTGRLLAITRTGEVAVSLDKGTTWAFQGTIPVSDVVRLRVLGSIPYALTGSGDVYRTMNGGTTWTAVSTLSQMGMTALTRDATSLFASTSAGEIATSSNGYSWTWRGAINQMSVTALGTDSPATVDVEDEAAPIAFALAPPWPNPSQADRPVNVSFRLAASAEVSVLVYDLAGRRVADRGPERFGAGPHTLTWNPGIPGSGLFFLRVSTDIGEEANVRLAIMR